METRSSYKFKNDYGTRNYLCDTDLFELGSAKFDMPTILSLEQKEPINLDFVPFNVYKKGDVKGVHFFVDDHLQNRIWNRPMFYAKKLEFAHTIFSPDFSPYDTLPEALQIFQIYRSRYLTRYFQECGLNVIPYININGTNTYEYALDGIPKGLMISMSSQGRTFVEDCVKLVIDKVEPPKIFCYGSKFAEKLNKIHNNIVYLPTFWDLKRNKYKRK